MNFVSNNTIHNERIFSLEFQCQYCIKYNLNSDDLKQKPNNISFFEFNENLELKEVYSFDTVDDMNLHLGTSIKCIQSQSYDEITKEFKNYNIRKKRTNKIKKYKKQR